MGKTQKQRTADQLVARLAKKTVLLAGIASMAACSTVDRLQQVGQAPALSTINNPTTQAGYRPVNMPMPTPVPAQYADNSLWQAGSRAFFRDQRARLVGDILTVEVRISDKAEIDNATSRSRTGSADMGIDALAGTENAIINTILPNGASAEGLIDLDSNSTTDGSGSIRREEALTTNVAAVVTQILPNGNMVIEGRQEIRVNFEIREMIVAGIIRPEDIRADNTIESTKIAEARISYGGRGHITDVQQPRYGQQILDIILPF
ncbi:MAG: flagellar basal body L-ring protein FlgH [Fimbriimonadaceae bacterium]|nr:flagellar basal body L-ring protein FlgH [Alphaproteobacteria bacterium]